MAVASTEASSSAKEDAGSTGEMEDQAGYVNQGQKLLRLVLLKVSGLPCE